MQTWIKDANGNKCSTEFYGSEEAAQKALDSLRDCRDCTNCSGCSGCSHVAKLYGRIGLKGDPETSPYTGAPAIPKIESIHSRILEAASQPEALDMGSWHTCGTTHCRAGWAVHLAGEPGYALERFHGTALAAQLIYRESSPEMPVSPPRFCETNEEALADMKRLADLEVSSTAA